MGNNYKQVSIQVADADKGELLIALLADMGYEGFEEMEEGLSAFIPAGSFDADALQVLLDGQGVSHTLQDIAPQNWNAVWESGFEPVSVQGFATIRAGFHAPDPTVQYEIVITPKMSFGTGHHATTYMMVEQMALLDFVSKKVFDFGTGTGVLAILAEKMGADAVFAIDNDDWSIDNAIENTATNGCSRITVQKADTIPTDQQFDIILANINLNVITASLSAIAAVCKPGTQVLLSGFLPQDEVTLKPLLAQYGFQSIVTNRRENWLCIATEAQAF